MLLSKHTKKICQSGKQLPVKIFKMAGRDFRGTFSRLSSSDPSVGATLGPQTAVLQAPRRESRGEHNQA